MASAISDCASGQVPHLRQFWAHMYRPDYVLCRDDALFQWQFAGPGRRADGLHVKLAIVDGEIAGTLGYIPVDVSYQGRIVRGTWLANWMVDEDQRRLGLGPLLMRAVTSQFDVTLNNGPNQEARSVLQRMAWSDMGTLTRYVLVLNPQAAASLTPSGRLDWPQPPRVASGAVPPDRVRRAWRFAPAVTDVWDALAPTLGSGTRRSVDYLNWRYIDHPVWEYRCFEAVQGSRCTGAGVYRIEQVRDLPVRFGRIVELFAEDVDAVAVLQAVIADARGEGVAALDFFCTSPRLAEPMQACGFVHGTDSPAAALPMLLQPVDHRRAAIHFMAYARPGLEQPQTAAWYVTRSDADQDRPN
jgi:hypothetical protein